VPVFTRALILINALVFFFELMLSRHGVEDLLQIARAILARKGKVTAFVPHYAMPGGSLLPRAADEIIMSEYVGL